MGNLNQIARWKSQRNPLCSVCGGGSTSPALLARGQEQNASMILYSEEFEETMDIRRYFMNDVLAYDGKNNHISQNDYFDCLTTGTNDKVIELKNGTTAKDGTIHGTSDGKCYISIKGKWCRVRRLTPRECWRLMDFDDSDFDKATRCVSDTQLYKQAGNSIVVNCLTAIFGQMFDGKENKYKER